MARKSIIDRYNDAGGSSLKGRFQGLKEAWQSGLDRSQMAALCRWIAVAGGVVLCWAVYSFLRGIGVV